MKQFISPNVGVYRCSAMGEASISNPQVPSSNTQGLLFFMNSSTILKFDCRTHTIHVFKYFRSSGLYAELFPKVWRTLTCQKLWEFCELWIFFRNHKTDFCKLYKRGNCYSWWRIIIRIFLYKTQPVSVWLVMSSQLRYI